MPIVALTASVLQEDRLRCMQSGMNDFLAKPVERGGLLHIFQTWLPTSSVTQVSSPASTQEIADDSVDERALDALMELRDDDGAVRLLPELIRMFETSTPTALSNIRNAASRHDASGLAEIAHKLKGSCGNFGARAMMSICDEIERHRRKSEVDTVDEPKDLVNRLQTEFGKVRNALKTYERTHLS